MKEEDIRRVLEILKVMIIICNSKRGKSIKMGAAYSHAYELLEKAIGGNIKE